MLEKEVAPTFKLEAVEAQNTSKVRSPFVNLVCNIFRLHPGKVEIAIKDGEGCARWRRDDPSRLLLSHHLEGQLLIIYAGKIPWRLVRLQTTEVHDLQTNNIQ